MMLSFKGARFRVGDSGETVGLDTGYGAYTEHEQGCAPFSMTFGVGMRGKDERPGIERRKVTQFQRDYLVFRRMPEGSDALAVFGMHSVLGGNPDRVIEYATAQMALGRLRENGLECCWDPGGFVFAAGTEEAAGRLEEVHAAAKARNLAANVPLSVAGWEPSSGMNVVIPDRLPPEALDALARRDESRDALEREDRNCHIRKWLMDAGKKYFALSPAWAAERGADTAYPLVYWLNPMEQGSNRSGWFTVEELEQWCCDEGPVVERPKPRM